MNAKAKPCKAIILGAGKPFSGDAHAGLSRVGERGSVLEWLLHAIKPMTADIRFVGGYRIESVAAEHPGLTYILNADWQSTGALESLFRADLDADCDLIVTYSDLVYWPDAVERLCAAGDDAVIVAVDSTFPARHVAANVMPVASTELVKSADGLVIAAGPGLQGQGLNEFVGLLRIPAAFMPAVLAMQAQKKYDPAKSHLSKLVDGLHQSGVPLRLVDLAGGWSDLNSPAALTRFVMGTKAQTLSRLEDRLKAGKVCPQICFRRSEFIADATAQLSLILGVFPGQSLAVRSSALSEDSFMTANAGVFHSVLNVASDPDSLRVAINDVIASFPRDDADHQVFIQPMVRDVIASGVAMTRLIQSGAPYYCVNYTENHQTDLITSGTSDDDRVMLMSRNIAAIPADAPRWMHGLLDVMRELEFLLDHDALDIEFAVTGHGDVYVLQVRPIIMSAPPAETTDRAIAMLQAQAVEQFHALQKPRPQIAGNRTAFGVMPDWNPAEIIGTRPGALSASLYADLIMDDVWAVQRAAYGYRDVRPQPLMRHFAGQPYVDIRASLNSFTPATLDPALAARLVDFYLGWLEKNPSLHDKIEFDVIPTCYSFDFERWEKRLSVDAGLADSDIALLKSSLHAITLAGFARLNTDWADIDRVQSSFAQIMRAMPAATIERAMMLIDDCGRLGTLTFAHLARAGFVAMTLLRSAVATNILSAGRLQDYLLSVDTVSSRFARDAWAVRSGAMAFDAFVDEYGHLRPGTYDVTSPCYRMDPEFYLRSAIDRAEKPALHDFQWTVDEQQLIGDALSRHALGLDLAGFDHFCRRAIIGREYAKFIFTRHLSAAIEDLCVVGHGFGFARGDIAHIPLSDWRGLAAGTLPDIDPERYLYDQLDKNSARYRLTSLVELPPLIFTAADCTSFILPVSQPNFITDSRIVTDLRVLDDDPVNPGDLAGRIVQIDAADPGYDWLFGQGIAGLITKYGGANSHMAIRAAEFGLPAAIGVGDVRYKTLSRARRIDLNCRNRQIVVVE